jgi:DNA helicase HerA-like ATPase
MSTSADPLLLGHVENDTAVATNERVLIRAPRYKRTRLLRNQYVAIGDALDPQTVFLGRVISGPFFPSPAHEGDHILAEVEIQGELAGHQAHDSNNRPAAGSAVREIPAETVCGLLGLEGDMVLGCLLGRQELGVALQSRNKDVLPRNVGIFGTVGSGKSNSVQVLTEEAVACGWAVVLLDLEAEYVDMDQPTTQTHLVERLARFGRQPQGLADFHVYYPVSCASDRAGSHPFTLRMADFDSSIMTELLQTNLAERNALLDCIDHFQQRFQSRLPTSDLERFHELLDPSPQAKLPYTLQMLRSRAVERSPRNSESLDYVGLGAKLQLLIHSGAFDQPNRKGLDPGEMLRPGRVSVIDVSVANDTIKNLVTADLLRKAFAYKLAQQDAPPTLLVVEEAHSFMNREKVHTMQATLQMLRNVTRRGRKRWLSVAFVSQQPGHLPPEIFELCNVRLVHTLRSLHNLDTLMATTGDVTRELWAHCPLLGTGEAILSAPQFRRSVVATIRPAMSSRRFVR